MPDGTNLGLIGPGGAGKTVLLKIITGLIEPDEGNVYFDEVDIHSLSETELAELRNDMGMLFQNYALFDFMTVSENIGFPLRQVGEVDEGDSVSYRLSTGRDRPSRDRPSISERTLRWHEKAG